uniref:CARDB domain-containing protein n=1 Tax=uncultured Draconibacterium sp. TaxID=1573823 RepID=UPI003216560B
LSLEYLNGAIVSGNTIRIKEGSQYNSSAVYANEVDGAWRFTGNRLSGAKDYGLYMRYCNSSSGDPGLIANNFIQSQENNYTVYFQRNSYQQFYHNNINAIESVTSMYYDGYNTSGNLFKNNIFKANTSYTVYVGNSSGIQEMDYNDLYTSGSNIAYWSGARADLTAWQTASGMDINSLNVDPQYQTDTVLIPQSPSLVEAGTDLTSVVSTDIDGNPRTVPVSIGAVEFGLASEPLAGDYTIDPLGSGDRNFTTFAAASEAMRLSGISASVRFIVRDTLFNEQVNFGSVSGASDTSRITFESLDGNVDSTIIRHGGVYTLSLDNAEHYIFRNMTFETSGTAQVIKVQNRAGDLLFEGNRIIAPNGSGTSTANALLYIDPTFADGIRILSNVFEGGNYGLRFLGVSNSNKASGTVVSGNTFTNVYYRSLELQFHSAPEIYGNIIQTGSTADQISIHILNTDNGLLLSENKVSSKDGNALRLTNVSGTVGTPVLVYNNYLQSEGQNRAIYISSADNMLFYHNSVWNQSSGAALEYVSYGSGNHLMNNIFQSGSGYSLYIHNGGAFDESDYNNLFTGGTNIGRWESSISPNLNDWQTASSLDNNSLTVDANFISTTDLAPQNEALASNGTDLTSVVATDIEGNLRTVPVSIGALEFAALTGLDLAVEQIINPGDACLLSDLEIVSVRIRNVGSTFAENITLSYQINALAPVEESLPAGTVVAPGEAYDFNFTQTADFSSKGDYEMLVSVLGTDEDATNNQLSDTITHYPDPVVSITPDSTICAGQNLTLIAEGGETYLWNTGSPYPTEFVNPTVQTTYSVTITDSNSCSVVLETTIDVLERPVLEFVGDGGYEAGFVAPTVGSDATEFVFRVKYTDQNGLLPAAGYPVIYLQSFFEDLEFTMVEEDAADTDVTDGKIYAFSISGLANDVDWYTSIAASNGNCSALPLGDFSPLVTSDFLDVAIFADDILFSNDEPAEDELFTITGRIRNTSDYVAENFEVQVYDDSMLIHTDTIVSVAPQSISTFNFDYAFTEFGYHEIKVVIDSQDSLLEKNELNNFAIRFYALPEGLSVTASMSKSTYYVGESVYANGQAYFTGLDAAITPPVKYAAVNWSVSNGIIKTTSTNHAGYFSAYLGTISEPGVYTVTGEVDEGRFVEPFGPLTFQVVVDPNNIPRPDLVTALNIDIPERGHYLLGETVTGIASIENTGVANADSFVFRYESQQGVLAEVFIDQLEPGEKNDYPFTTILEGTNTCVYTDRFWFRSQADRYNQVSEISEGNNTDTKYIKQYSDKVELEPYYYGSGYFNLEDPYSFTYGIKNKGGIPLEDTIEYVVLLDSQLYVTQTIASLGVCASDYQSSMIQFTDTINKELIVNVDVPLNPGLVLENDETNNSTRKIIKYKPKKPDLTTSKFLVWVEPAYPALNEDFTLFASFSNSQDKAITSAFTNQISVTESGVLRTQATDYLSGFGAKTNDTIEYTTQIASYGDHSSEIFLDSNEEINEGNEFNNQVEMPLCADLKPRALSLIYNSYPQVFTNQTLVARVENPALFTPTDVSIAFYLDDSLIATTSLNEAPTTFYPNYLTATAPYVFTEPGTYTLKVVLDYLNEYEECDETNNEYSHQITVRTPGPDLRVLPVYISPTKLNPDLDEPIDLFVSFDNIGSVPAGPFKVRLNIDGVQIGQDVPVSGVAAGEDGTVAITESYSSGIGGLKTLEAIIDVDDEQGDPDRSNNVAERTIFVGDAPNLYFVSFDLSDDCPDNGSPLTIDAVIGNEGDISASGNLTFYHKIGDSLQVISSEPITVEAKGQLAVSVETNVISNTFDLFAEITDTYPFEYNTFDNTITRSYCTVSTDVLLTTAVFGSGIITRTPNENTFALGSNVSLTAVPANGWRFDHWSDAATGSDNPLVLTMDTAKNVVAHFVEEFRVDLNISNESCVDAQDGQMEVNIFAGSPPYTIEWYKDSVLLAGETDTLLENLSVGTYDVVVIDSQNDTVSEQGQISVGDLEKPHIVTHNNIIVYLDANGNGTLTELDVDNGSYDNCAIDSMHLSQTVFSCADTGLVNLLFEIFDTNGNQQEATVPITVLDTVKPVFANVPDDIFMDNDIDLCSNKVEWNLPIATDNCEMDTLWSNYLSGDTFDVGTTTVIYTAEDIHGNISVDSF